VVSEFVCLSWSQNLIATKVGVQKITGITVFDSVEKKTYEPLPDLEVCHSLKVRVVLLYSNCRKSFIQMCIPRTITFEYTVQSLGKYSRRTGLVKTQELDMQPISALRLYL